MKEFYPEIELTAEQEAEAAGCHWSACPPARTVCRLAIVFYVDQER